MGCVDQLNLPALLSGEYAVRRLQLIKEAYRLSPSAPDFSAADFFMGWGARRHGAVIDPNLAKHVAMQLKADAEIQKEARKAREESGHVQLVDTAHGPEDLAQDFVLVLGTVAIGDPGLS